MQKFKDFFNERKPFKKYSGRKRKIFGSTLLGFGNLKSDYDKPQNYLTATPLSHERRILNHLRILTVQTGNGIIFALKQKVHDSSFNEEFHLLDQDD